MSDIEMLDEENFDDLEVIEEPEAPEAEEAADGETTPKVVKAKRVIRNPQPKLNAETLKGKRGLAALPSYFERVRFKGRGYEEQDLSVILKTYEYWCHRLFPKYPFDACIAKIEQLGTKKPVLTHIKRIRHDLLLEDVVGNEEVIEAPDAFDELVPDSEPVVDLSEEQLERIRLNKENAERRRRERLQQQMEGSQRSQNDSDEESMSAQRREVSQAAGDILEPKKGRRPNRIFDDSDDDDNPSSPATSSNDQNIDPMETQRTEVSEAAEDLQGRTQNRLFDDSDDDEDPSSPARSSKQNIDPMELQTPNYDTPSLNNSNELKNVRRKHVLADSDEDIAEAVNEAPSSPALKSNEQNTNSMGPQSQNNSNELNNARHKHVLDDSDEDVAEAVNGAPSSPVNNRNRLRALIDSDED